VTFLNCCYTGMAGCWRARATHVQQTLHVPRCNQLSTLGELHPSCITHNQQLAASCPPSWCSPACWWLFTRSHTPAAAAPVPAQLTRCCSL
jgi:hypothetical protein